MTEPFRRTQKKGGTSPHSRIITLQQKQQQQQHTLISARIEGVKRW